MFRQQGEAAKINCSHSIQDYNRIYFYKQSHDRRMQLLGYMNVDYGYLKAGVDVTIKGSATKGKTCTITISELRLNSSAVYFCAAS